MSADKKRLHFYGQPSNKKYSIEHLNATCIIPRSHEYEEDELIHIPSEFNLKQLLLQ